MAAPLHTLLTANPFTILGLTVDVTSRDVRRRLEELEMEAAFGGDAPGRTDSVRAAQTLDDAAARLECELFAPWGDTATFGSVAAVHDKVLDQTRQAFDRGAGNIADAAVRALRSWLAFARDPSAAPAYEQRATSLGVPSATLIGTIAGRIVPALVARGMERTDGDASGDLTTLLAALPAWRQVSTVLAAYPDYAHAGAELLVHRMKDALSATPDLDALSEHGLQALILAVANVASDLSAVPPLDATLVATLVETCLPVAIRHYNQDRLSQAETILDTLMRCELREADRSQVLGLLRQTRFLRAWQQANEHGEYGEWRQCIEQLERAEALAPDRELADKMRGHQQAARTALRNGIRGQRTRPAARPIPSYTPQEHERAGRVGGKTVAVQQHTPVTQQTRDTAPVQAPSQAQTATAGPMGTAADGAAHRNGRPSSKPRPAAWRRDATIARQGPKRGRFALAHMRGYRNAALTAVAGVLIVLGIGTYSGNTSNASSGSVPSGSQVRESRATNTQLEVFRRGFRETAKRITDARVQANRKTPASLDNSTRNNEFAQAASTVSQLYAQLRYMNDLDKLRSYDALCYESFLDLSSSGEIFWNRMAIYARAANYSAWNNAVQGEQAQYTATINVFNRTCKGALLE